MQIGGCSSIMRKYYLYLIKENIASDYMGKERMFYKLFSEHTKTDDSLLKLETAKQIDYITLPISVWKLQKLLYSNLQNNKSFKQLDSHTYYIENGNLSSARLKLTKQYIIIEAEGYYDAESIFFEILRKNEPSFLAIDVENARFGWLKPIKERNLI
jgi:hypothetical protein